MGEARPWYFGVVLLALSLPVTARAQDVPKATAEGKKALAELLSACTAAGGLERTGEGPAASWRADPGKLRATLAAWRDQLTPTLRDALVAAWFESDRGRQRACTALLRACGEQTRDSATLGFAAFFAAVEERLGARLDPAREHFEEAARHFAAADSPSWQALSLSNLGFLHASRGRYVAAIDHYRRALALQRKAHSGPHRDIAATLANLGGVYDQMGKYAESLDHHLQALEVQRKLHDGPHPEVAHQLKEVGTACYKLGDYAGALEWFEKELAMQRRLHRGPHPAVASSLWHLGVTHDRLRDYPQALDCHLQALAMRTQLYDSPHPDLATSLHSVGLAYLQLHRSADALKHYQEALTQRRQLYRPPHPRLAEALEGVGHAYDEGGDKARALRYHEEALAMRRQLYPGPHPDVAKSLGYIGSLYAALGKADRALEYHQQALAMRQQFDPPPWPDIAISWNNIGSAHAALGQYQEALKAHHRALAIKEKLFHGPHPALANSLGNIGHVLELAGAYDEALKYQKRALAMRQQVSRGDDPDLAATWSNLGGIHFRRGDYDEALRCQRQALAIRRRLHRAGHPDIALSLSAIATIYYTRGEYGRALEYYREGLALRQRFYDQGHPLIGDSLNNLGATYFALNDYSHALPCFHAVLDADRKRYRGPHPDIASSLNNLGAICTYQGDFARALRYHREALEMRQKLYDKPHPDIALSLFNLASVYAYLKEYDRAENYHRQALAMRRQILGRRHPEVAASLNNLGALYYHKGDYDRAVATLDEALGVLQLPGADEPLPFDRLTARQLQPSSLTVNVLHYRGQALEGKAGGHPATAVLRDCERSYTLAAAVLDRLRQQVLESDISKLTQGEQSSSLVPRRIGVLGRLFALEGKVEDLHDAFTAAEQGRGRVFLESLGRAHATRLAGLPADLRAEEVRLGRKPRLLDAALRAAQDRPGTAAEVVRKLWQQRQDAEDELRRFEARLTRDYPRYAALRYPQPCTVEQARACLDEREAALLFAVGEEASYALVFQGRPAPGDRADGLAVVALPGVAVLREKVEAVTQKEKLELPDGVRDLSAELYRLLLKPLEEHIRGKDLVIVPDGPLCQLPFELLVEGATDEDEGHYLIERHRIRYAPSLTALHLIRLWEEGRKDRPDSLLWALGDPIFDPSDERLKGPIAVNAASRAALREVFLREGRSEGRAFPRLEASGAEVRGIARLLAAPEGVVLTDAAATEAAVKKSSTEDKLVRAKYVHFATHGILGLDTGRPPALVLSLMGTTGQQDEYGTDDGFLTLPEVSALKLNADLVVLSACRTGQGRMRNGEGVSGLARVFLYAGSRGVVCSLWSVEDRATSDLMQGMYRRLQKGESTADALRQAKLDMIREERPPLLWAPFIHLGR